MHYKASPHIYEAKSGTGDSGRVVFGKNECSLQQAVPCNIHYSCEPTSKNDVHINAGLVKIDFNPTYNESDTLSVDFTILAQPDENGEYGFAGAGNLTKPTRWDATTQSFVDVAPDPSE